jgi:ribonuclease BN (tRNA processing enzyme)
MPQIPNISNIQWTSRRKGHKFNIPNTKKARWYNSKKQKYKKTYKSSNKYICNPKNSIFYRNTLHREEEGHAVNIRLHQNEHRILSF